MNSNILFSETNEKGKKNWLILITILIIWFTIWTLGFTLSLVIKLPGTGIQNNFYDNLVDNVFIIIFLFLLFSLIVFLFIFRAKSNRFKYSITITPKVLTLAIPQNNKTTFLINEIQKYETIEKIQNYAKLKILFNDTQIVIKTRKYNELKNILDYVLDQNKI